MVSMVNLTCASDLKPAMKSNRASSNPLQKWGSLFITIEYYSSILQKKTQNTG
jgi:hypothetical protein